MNPQVDPGDQMQNTPPVEPPKEPIKTEGQVPPVEPPAPEDPPPGDEGIKDLEAAKKVIADLRKENAKNRTSRNALETDLSKFKTGLKKLFGEEDEDEVTPEKLAKLKSARDQSDTKAALLELAFENNVPKENFKYFRFLVEDALDNLEEGQEFTEEDAAKLAKESGTKVSSSTTTVPPEGKGAPPAKGQPGAIGLDEFLTMSMGEKSALYSKDKDLYEALLQQAKESKRLV